MFRVGQKVVCVDREGTEFGRHGSLSEGSIYTVREVCVTRLGRPGVKLVEYEHSTADWNVGRTLGLPFSDAPLRSTRFRPVVERKTDISIFTAMLNPSKRKVSA